MVGEGSQEAEEADAGEEAAGTAGVGGPSRRAATALNRPDRAAGPASFASAVSRSVDENEQLPPVPQQQQEVCDADAAAVEVARCADLIPLGQQGEEVEDSDNAIAVQIAFR